MMKTPSKQNQAQQFTQRIKKAVFLCAGLFLTALGIIGAFLPIMPTTVFLIAAVWCFSRSSQRFEAWLLNHPRFGATLRNWQKYGAISGTAKLMASLGMALGYGIFYFSAQPSLALALLVAACILSCATYVLSRPRPPSL